MTAHQKDLVAKLVLANLIVYAVIAFYWYQPALPSLPNPFIRPTAVALQPGSSIKPILLPATVATPAPSPTRTLRPAPRIQPAATPAASSAVITADAGNAPSNPMTPADAWRTIGAGAKVWYKIGRGGSHIAATLDAKPLDGITMDVYAPGQLEQPIGRGTLQRGMGLLVWAGGHWQSEGDWLACVTNSNPIAVQYKLTSTGKDMSGKSCYSYWEEINGQPVYWTRCD